MWVVLDYHFHPDNPTLMIGLLLPIPTPSPSVNPLMLFLHPSCLRCLRFSSFVKPSARRTCSFEEGWCLTPWRPRPLMSSRLSDGPWVVQVWAVGGGGGV